jgi:hypothetical protein
MQIALDIIGVAMLALGFWVFVGAFDRTGRERARRIRIALGSAMVGAGNILYLSNPGTGMALLLLGAFISLTAGPPVRSE